MPRETTSVASAQSCHACSPAARDLRERHQRPDQRQPNLAAVRVPGDQQIGLDVAQREVRSVAHDDLVSIRGRDA